MLSHEQLKPRAFEFCQPRVNERPQTVRMDDIRLHFPDQSGKRDYRSRLKSLRLCQFMDTRLRRQSFRELARAIKAANMALHFPGDQFSRQIDDSVFHPSRAQAVYNMKNFRNAPTKATPLCAVNGGLCDKPHFFLAKRPEKILISGLYKV